MAGNGTARVLASALLGGAAGVALSRLAVPGAYRELFERMGRELGVDPNLLHAIGWKESNLTPDAIGPENRNGTRDYGLMQINESNFAALGLDAQTALDPERSVRAAATLLAEIGRVNKTVPDLLAVYNAGPSSVASRVGGPKLTADGAYINLTYVIDGLARYFLVVVGHGLTAAVRR